MASTKKKRSEKSLAHDRIVELQTAITEVRNGQKTSPRTAQLLAAGLPRKRRSASAPGVAVAGAWLYVRSRPKGGCHDECRVAGARERPVAIAVTATGRGVGTLPEGGISSFGAYATIVATVANLLGLPLT